MDIVITHFHFFFILFYNIYFQNQNFLYIFMYILSSHLCIRESTKRKKKFVLSNFRLFVLCSCSYLLVFGWISDFQLSHYVFFVCSPKCNRILILFDVSHYIELNSNQKNSYLVICNSNVFVISFVCFYLYLFATVNLRSHRLTDIFALFDGFCFSGFIC